MAEQVSQINDATNLRTTLLSTLDESKFFNELGDYVHSVMNVDRTSIFLVKEDQSVESISIDGKAPAEVRRMKKGEGPQGYVVRTKRPYFSNNTQRDPLFEREAEQGVLSELCIPVAQEGVVIGTVHLQSMESFREFDREDIQKVMDILEDVKEPLSNMKMYLSAKLLNESLIKKIEEKERELEDKSTGANIISTFKIEEKKIVSKSKAMKDILHLADKVALSEVNVFIEGENGTGREMIAKRIHCRSARTDKSFVTVDCSTLPELQLEAEIFGEERGTFSNFNVRPGLLESANGGTIFIKDIENLSLHLQNKLNLFLNEKLAFRVAGQMPYRSDVRIIASSTCDLAEKVKEGVFREDLFYALNTMKLKVPALKERKDDIEALASYFLNLKRPVDDFKSLSPCVIKTLKEYKWPGNVRELQNVIERAYIIADGMIVEKDHLSETVTATEGIEEKENDEVFKYTEMTLDELEKKHICFTLGHLGGNKTKTARTLGITVKTLYNKLHSYGMIQPKDS